MASSLHGCCDELLAEGNLASSSLILRHRKLREDGILPVAAMLPASLMLQRPQQDSPSPNSRLQDASSDGQDAHPPQASRFIAGLPARWMALNHAIAVNQLLGDDDRVAMTNRSAHPPTEESNAQIYAFFEHWLK